MIAQQVYLVMCHPHHDKGRCRTASASSVQLGPPVVVTPLLRVGRTIR